jgi:hypothetical protein
MKEHHAPSTSPFSPNPLGLDIAPVIQGMVYGTPRTRPGMDSDKRYRLYECLIVFAIALKYFFAISLQEFGGPLPREYILGIVGNFASETLAIHVLMHFLSRILIAMEQRREETIRKEWGW